MWSEVWHHCPHSEGDPVEVNTAFQALAWWRSSASTPPSPWDTPGIITRLVDAVEQAHRQCDDFERRKADRELAEKRERGHT